MIDRGDVQLGAEVPITVQCKAGVIPTTPDFAPVLSLYDADGALIERRVMAADNQTQVPGLFRSQLFLNALYEAGPVTGHIQWQINGAPYGETVWFRILPGGNANGSVVAATFVRRPAGTYIVWEADSGTILRGTNPRSKR